MSIFSGVPAGTHLGDQPPAEVLLWCLAKSRMLRQLMTEERNIPCLSAFEPLGQVLFASAVHDEPAGPPEIELDFETPEAANVSITMLYRNMRACLERGELLKLWEAVNKGPAFDARSLIRDEVWPIEADVLQCIHACLYMHTCIACTL